MHSASPALRDTAPEFGASQTDHVAQDPKKGGIGLYVDLPGCSVDMDRNHCGSPSASKNSLARSAGVVCDQAGNALAAASTASFASGRPPAATRAYRPRS